MILILLLTTLFDALDAQTYFIRNKKTQELIKLGVTILPDIDKQLQETHSKEKELRLRHIRTTILIADEIQQHKNLLRRNKKSTLIGWSFFSTIVGPSYKARQFYYYLYKVHRDDIQQFFNSEDKEQTAMLIAKKLRNNRSYHWEVNAFLYFLEILLEIDLDIKISIGYYYDPPSEYIFIYNRLKE